MTSQNWPVPKVQHALTELWHDLAALVFPCACLGCGAADRALCRVCRDSLLASARVIELAHLPGWFAAGHYEGLTRSLIVALKHGSQVRFARDLGALLATPLAQVLARSTGQASVLIVTAPSRKRAVSRRGFHHVDLVVHHALRVLGGRGAGQQPSITRALRATRHRTGQVGLTLAERRHNAARVRVRSGVRHLLWGREVVLVDDVMTTGATLEAAAEALTSAGARVLGAVAIATVPRRAHLGSEPGAPAQQSGRICAARGGRPMNR